MTGHNLYTKNTEQLPHTVKSHLKYRCTMQLKVLTHVREVLADNHDNEWNPFYYEKYIHIYQFIRSSKKIRLLKVILRYSKIN